MNSLTSSKSSEIMTGVMNGPLSAGGAVHEKVSQKLNSNKTHSYNVHTQKWKVLGHLLSNIAERKC